MKPLVTYYGGKQRMAPKIVPIIERIAHSTYVEPFAGGAAVLFAKPPPRTANFGDYREVLNDLDGEIINLYRVVQTRPADLLHRLEYTPYSNAERERAGDILRHPEDHDDLARAWAIVVQLRMTFSSLSSGGWSTSTTVNHAAQWANHRDRLPAIFARLRNVAVSCEDALRCIARWDSPDTLFYVDPPYPGADTDYRVGRHYALEDFAALCAALDAAQGSWILSNYPQPVEPATAEERVEITASMSASQSRDHGGTRPTRTEVLWIRGVRALQPSLWTGVGE